MVFALHGCMGVSQELCGPPATTDGWMDPGLLHAAVLTGLHPGTRYYYIYGDPVRGGSSETPYPEHSANLSCMPRLMSPKQKDLLVVFCGRGGVLVPRPPPL